MSMTCQKPLQMYYNEKLGKHQITYSKECRLEPISVNCGKCPACQERFQTELALRVTHEMSFHDKVQFITLTVSDDRIEEIFPGASLAHEPFQLFMKRYRRYLDKRGIKIRYLMCGEYGAKGGRPHYHAIIFGHRFDDEFMWNEEKKLMRSHDLEKLWPYGFSSIGAEQIDINGAKYLSKYVAKAKEKTWEDYVCPYTGQLKKKEYLVYPRGKDGGLGYQFYKTFRKGIFEKGYFTLPRNAKTGKSAKVGIPRYYKKKFQEEHEDDYLVFKAKQMEKLAIKNKELKVAIAKDFTEEEIKDIKVLVAISGQSKSQTELDYIKAKVELLSEEDIYIYQMEKGAIAMEAQRKRNELFKS